MGIESAFAPGHAITSLEADATQFVLEDYSHALFIHNPVSTRASGADALLKRLCADQMMRRLEISAIETQPAIADIMEDLSDHVDGGTFIIVRSGDGGVSAVLNAIRAAKIVAPTLVVASGNKNDFARQLFSGRHIKNPEAALGSAVIREVRPIQVRVEPDDAEERSVDAFSYVSIGVSAAVAAHVNDPAYRKRPLHRVPGGRFLAERGTALGRAATGRHFNVSVGEPGKPETFVEIIAANGSRMAGEFHPQADLLVPGFRLIQARHKLGEIGVMAALRAGLPIGDSVLESEALRLTCSENEGSYLQIDGEHSRLGPAVITLSTAPSGVMVLTDRF